MPAMMRRVPAILIASLLIAAGACSEDAPVGEPGGMGGTPAQRGPDPALEVLSTTDHPAHQDTLVAGAAQREAHTEPAAGPAAPATPAAGGTSGY